MQLVSLCAAFFSTLRASSVWSLQSFCFFPPSPELLAQSLDNKEQPPTAVVFFFACCCFKKRSQWNQHSGILFSVVGFARVDRAASLIRTSRKTATPAFPDNEWREGVQQTLQLILFSVASSSAQQPCSDALCFFLQREAERAAPGETEVGGEDHGPVQGSGAQHAISCQQGQVLYIHLYTSLLVTMYESWLKSTRRFKLADPFRFKHW